MFGSVQYLIFNLQRRGGDLTEMREMDRNTHIDEILFHARHTVTRMSEGKIDTKKINIKYEAGGKYTVSQKKCLTLLGFGEAR